MLFADVAGYSRLMEQSEQSVHDRLMSLQRDILTPAIESHQGRIIKRTGDGFLATFSSAGNAVACGVTIQHEVARTEGNLEPDESIRFRMGINVGEVIAEENDVFGHDVNVAARLQELAEPGSIMISAAARAAAESALKDPALDLGLVALKNMEQPVHVFRVGGGTVVVSAEGQRGRTVPRPSIAVLPFRNLGRTKDSAYFGEAIVEDIVAAIASLRDLQVISRNSTVAMPSTASGRKEAAERLGVRYILSGTVQLGSGRVRVTTELADMNTGHVQWARRFDFANDKLFDVQDQITAGVVNSIAPQIQQTEIKRALQKRPESMTAYDHMLQALHLIYRLEPRDFARAGSLLKRAIALDDSYAAAYALSAEWHGLRIGQGWSQNPKADAIEAIRLAEAAIHRDGNNALALATLGHHRAFLFREYDAAMGLFDRALTINPGSARAWGLSAPTCSYVGNPDAAISRAEQSLLLSPYDPLVFFSRTAICIARYTAGDYEHAVDDAYRSLADNPRYTAVWKFLSAALAGCGRITDAKRAAAQVLRLEPEFSVQAYAARYPYRDPARSDRLRQHLLEAGLPE